MLNFRISAIVGFLAVALGAFGAHGLKGMLMAMGTLEIWEKAAHYHLVHAVVLLFVAGRTPFACWSWRLFLAGIFLFSGSLYLLAVTGNHWLGMVTPVGGLCLLAGWIALAFQR